MRYLPIIMLATGVLAVAFAHWGVNTISGRRAFDEMAGMIPLAVGAVGVILFVAGLVWMLLRLRS